MAVRCGDAKQITQKKTKSMSYYLKQLVAIAHETLDEDGPKHTWKGRTCDC